MTWQKLSSEIKYQNRFMTVTEDAVVNDYGDHLTFGVVHKEPAVMIIPWDGKKFTLIRQYRYPVDFESWEFPAGHYEHSSVEEAARAELEEEAGLKAGQMTKLGEYHIAPGHNTQVCHIYLATELTGGTRHLENAEKGMQIGEFSLTELNNFILEGKIKDGLTIVALKFFELKSA